MTQGDFQQSTAGLNSVFLHLDWLPNQGERMQSALTISP